MNNLEKKQSAMRARFARHEQQMVYPSDRNQAAMPNLLANLDQGPSLAPLDQALFELPFTAKELAEQWHVSTMTIRRLFQDEPGVIRLGNSRTLHKRPYIVLRIPVSVAARVYLRLRREIVSPSRGNRADERIRCLQKIAVR